QVSGQRIGETTNLLSPEATYLFQILPLPPPTNYVTWAKGYWPPGFNPPTTLAQGNPDNDSFNNLLEYAFHLSPTNADDASNAPLFAWITNNQRYGALTFTRYMPALDLSYVAEMTRTLPGGWTPLTNPFATVPNTNGVTQLVTMEDFLPATNRQR